MVVAACVAAAGVGQAAISYVTDVQVFVGKGDLQLACGFNNQAAQKFLTESPKNNGENWELRSLKSVSYAAACEGDVWTGDFYTVETGTNKQGSPIYKKEKLMTSGTATLEASKNVKTSKTATETIRKQTQITGIFLNIGQVTEEATGANGIPKLGDACGNGLQVSYDSDGDGILDSTYPGTLQSGTVSSVAQTGETYQVPEGVWVNCSLQTRNGNGDIINPGTFVGYTGVGLVVSGT